MNILSTVGTENSCTLARWLALERACHRLHSFVFVFVGVSFIHCFSSRSRKVFVSSSRFLLRLSTVQVLCNLSSVVLEILRLDGICVSWRLDLELFLREEVSHCKALLLRTFLGLDLRLVPWSFRSISDCAPISMFVSIHSTSSLRDTRHVVSN